MITFWKFHDKLVFVKIRIRKARRDDRVKKLVIYYSRTGENYVNGTIKVLAKGNTEVAAEMIQKLTGADLFKIEQLQPYSDNYNECIEEAKRDQRNAARPELKKMLQDVGEYDVIYIGYPNYWSTMPMAVFTLLDSVDFTGKTIKPFCTHEGSGMGSSERDLKKYAKGAMVEKGLAIHGASVTKAEEMIKAWI